MTSQRKLDMVGTLSTIQKRAKRMPDITVQTTNFELEEGFIVARKSLF